MMMMMMMTMIEQSVGRKIVVILYEDELSYDLCRVGNVSLPQLTTMQNMIKFSNTGLSTTLFRNFTCKGPSGMILKRPGMI
jgi:hypothetical protein